MTTRNSFNGAIGAWVMDELHPDGAGVNDPNSDFSSLRLNKVYEGLDFLCICFYTIDMSNPAQPTISTGNKALGTIVADAKAQNPNIKLFATLGYGGDVGLPLHDTICDNPTLLQAFANNVVNYLTANQMDGIDMDWEWNQQGTGPSDVITPPQFAALLSALRAAFGSSHYISLSPATTNNIDANALNTNCDIINIQNYYNDNLPNLPNQFVNCGVNASLIGFGAKFESISAGGPPYQNGYQAYTQYSAGFQTDDGNVHAYNTICSWRLDSDNWAFEQGQQLLLRQYIKGNPRIVSFDDSTIINVQTTATLMNSVTIWNGEVVDAIQTANQNQDGSYIVQMLQHGGDTGAQNPTISLPGGLTSFSYVTGNWYGNQVIVQITINGNSYPESITQGVTGTQTVPVNAPDGQTIVALKGASEYVLLAGTGNFTWVLSSLSAVCQ